jgi:hypothetical protein
MNKVPKSSKNFNCDICHYSTSRKSQYLRHVATDKHKFNDLAMVSNDLAMVKSSTHTCENCKKKYKDNSGLWRHKQKCCVIKSTNDESVIDKELVMMILKQNQELQKQMIDVCKQIQPSNIIHTNSHNKTFNLNLFLNEQCKDAMNITDFVDSLHLQLTDIEKIGEMGYVNGLSNIIIKNLKAIDLHKRPLHCSDTKRETIYIKDADKWEKENDEKVKLNKAITNIANKNIRMIPMWREQNPDCIHSYSNKSDQYNDIIIHSMDTDKNSNQKIITNIAKEIKIDKETGVDQ